MLVKDTNLINVQPGDILMYRAGDLLWPDWDVLGGLISLLEGNEGRDRDPKLKGWSKGDYTHCGWVRDVPNPLAEVEEVQSGIFKVRDGNCWKEVECLPSKWEGEVEARKILRCNMGIRIHATWPCIKQESIDWENSHMELWRMRRATPEIVDGILKLAMDKIGWQYDISDFLTFGGLHLPSAEICSEFIEEQAYYASMLRSDKPKIELSPRGHADAQKTPNELINSGELVKITYQGALAG